MSLFLASISAGTIPSGGGGGGGDGSVPTIVGTPSVIGSTGPGTYNHALPDTTANGDVILFFAESSNEAVTMVTSGYAEASDSPASGTATRLTIFWKRSGGGETHANVNVPTNHAIVTALIFRGCLSSGNPFDVTAASSSGTTGTSITIPGDTTTIDNCLVVAATATANDNNSSSFFSNWTNASLSSFGERADGVVDLGNGGGIGIATGAKATAGAYSNTTVTQVQSSEWVAWSGALKPNPA